MKKITSICGFQLSIFLLVMTLVDPASAQVNKGASYALIKRVIPQRADSFVVEQLNVTGKDAFEIESKNGKVILRGNNGVAVASALYYYLNEYCHCQITWNG